MVFAGRDIFGPGFYADHVGVRFEP
jgi:hypothetical protein